MKRRDATAQALAELTERVTSEEAEMTDQQTGSHRGLPDDVRAAVRAMWALGDYNRFATELDSQLGRDLVEACGIGAGQRVLDVAAGTGNVAIRAAEAGADVVASDITVENMKAGEQEAYLPPPPAEARSPLLWGDEAHVRELFGDRVSSLEASERELVETVPGTPADFCNFYRQTFGPVIAAFASVEDDPERSAALEREFLDFVKGANAGSVDGPTELRFEYLLVLARTQG